MGRGLEGFSWGGFGEGREGKGGKGREGREGGGKACLGSGRGKRPIEPEEFLLVLFRGDFEHRYADYSGCHFPRRLLLSALLWVGWRESWEFRVSE